MNKIIHLILQGAIKFKSKLVLFENAKKQKELFQTFASIGENCKITSPYMILNPHCIAIGKNFTTLYNLRIEAWELYMGDRFTPTIVIGDNVCFNTDVHIGCINKVIIGNNVLIASRVYISDHSHGNIDADTLKINPIERKLISKGSVIIEDNVWIGEGVCILPNVTIGANSIIGANAVVTKSCSPNSVLVGIPAKVIKNLI